MPTSAWGSTGTARSCAALLDRIEQNDPTLCELVILPLKTFGAVELLRVASSLCLNDVDVDVDRGNVHLRSLQASGHKIGDDDDDDAQKALEMLGKAVASNCNSLVDLAVGDATLSDKGVVSLCRGMSQGATTATAAVGGGGGGAIGKIKLERLDLSYKGMGMEGLNALVATLGQQTALQWLDLSRNHRIWPVDFAPDQRPLFPSLKYLDVSDCSLNIECAFKWIEALQPNDTAAAAAAGRRPDVVLRLNGNRLGCNDDNDNDRNRFIEFATFFGKRSCLFVKELHLAKCHIGNGELKILAEVWTTLPFNCDEALPDDNLDTSSCSHTEYLDLSQNQFTADGLNGFASKVHGSTMITNVFGSLKRLNLSGNNLDDESCLNLASSIVDAKKLGLLQQLQELDLSQTMCGVKAAVELIEHCELTNLNLFGNQLGAVGFSAMSKVLKGGHSVLRSLDVGGNEATEASVVTLLQALLVPSLPKEQNTLRLLVVGGNNTGPTVEAVVKEIETIHVDLDIARDKPKQNQNGGNF